MRWTVKENEESLCVGMAEEDIPDRVPANLRILRKNRTYYTLAENIAGIVPFNNEHFVSIVPKYPAIDPIELLLYIHNMEVAADERRVEQYAAGNEAVRIETLAQIFARELIAMQAQPVKFTRKPTKLEVPSIRGKVDWIRTARIQQQGRLGLIATTQSIPTTIIPENIIIAKAAQKVMSLFPRASREWDVLYRWSIMPVPSRTPVHFFSRFNRAFRQDQFSGAHAYYYNAVVLAQAVLGFAGLAGGTDFEEDAILFNMPSLYEDFVRTAFRRKAKPLGLTCLKGFTPRSYLFNEGNCELIPDIAIYYGSEIRALLDVKYKTPDSKDLYQLYSYMKYAELSRAYIISPAVRDGETIVSFDGCQIEMVRVNASLPTAVEQKAQTLLGSII